MPLLKESPSLAEALFPTEVFLGKNKFSERMIPGETKAPGTEKHMKKTLALLLSLCMLLCLLASCADKGGSGNEGTNAATEGNGTNAATDAATEPDESKAPETDAATEPTETEPEETQDPNFPPFDTTAPWDGVSASLRWYKMGDWRSGYELTNAYDLKGFAMMVAIANGGVLYYDPNYMVIRDTDGDGDLTDEAGYDEENVIAGDKFAGCEILLKADVDLNGKEWSPIGLGSSFQGKFMGEGYTVSNFTVSAESACHPTLTQSYYGFFAYIANGAEVRDLTVADATFEVDSLDDKNDDVYLSIFGCNVGAVTVANCNAYNITYNVKKLGNNNTCIGYMICIARVAGTSVTGCKVYNYTYNGDISGANEHHDWYGVDQANGGATFTGCEVLTADPR